jgi:hypothetical protein
MDWALYRELQLYIDAETEKPIAFMPVAVHKSGRIYDDFLRLLFLHAHREASALDNDIPEESVTFVFFARRVYLILRGQWV